MKITIAPVAAGPAWGTEVGLTDGLYASPEGFTYNGKNLADIFPVLDSEAQMALNRGNQISTLSFTFTHEKASFGLSEEDLVLYFGTIPRFGKITFYAEGALSTPFAYMVGAITDFSHTQIGVSTIRNFTIVGSPITDSEPAVPAFYPPPDSGSGSGSGSGP